MPALTSSGALETYFAAAGNASKVPGKYETLWKASRTIAAASHSLRGLEAAGSRDLWLRQRRHMRPACHRERVAAHAETMVALEGG